MDKMDKILKYTYDIRDILKSNQFTRIELEAIKSVFEMVLHATNKLLDE